MASSFHTLAQEGQKRASNTLSISTMIDSLEIHTVLQIQMRHVLCTHPTLFSAAEKPVRSESAGGVLKNL